MEAAGSAEHGQWAQDEKTPTTQFFSHLESERISLCALTVNVSVAHQREFGQPSWIVIVEYNLHDKDAPNLRDGDVVARLGINENVVCVP